MTGYWLNILTTFIFLIVLLIIAIFFVLKKPSKLLSKRLLPGVTAKNPIKILARQSLGYKEQLYLLEVENQTFLIGKTANQISFISDVNRTKTHE